MNETMGKFTELLNVNIENNMVKAPMNRTTTKAQLSLTLKNATQWKFDFSKILAFPNVEIQSIEYSLTMLETSENQFVRHVALNPGNHIIIIKTDLPCDATVFCKIDQSNYYYN